MGSARVVGFLSTWINHTTLESVSVDESQSGKVETLDGFFFFFFLIFPSLEGILFLKLPPNDQCAHYL